MRRRLGKGIAAAREADPVRVRRKVPGQTREKCPDERLRGGPEHVQGLNRDTDEGDAQGARLANILLKADGSPGDVRKNGRDEKLGDPDEVRLSRLDNKTI